MEVNTQREIKKNTYIELLRIMAAFFVISNHVNDTAILYSPFSASWYAGLALVFVSKIAVPIFLMISGSLLLNKIDNRQKHMIRIGRLCCVIVLFTIIYYLSLFNPLDMSLSDFLQRLLYGITNAYWYLYLYLGILIMLPILQKMTSILGKREIELFLFISLVVGGGLPMLELFSGFSVKNEFLEVIFSPYLGMFLTGYYIDKYITINKKHMIVSSVAFLIIILLQVLITVEYYKLDSENYMLLDNRVFLTIISSAICFFVVIKFILTTVQISKGIKCIINYLGGLTFGIYLLSDLIIFKTYGLFYQHAVDKNALISFLGYTIFIFVVGGVCTAVLKMIPWIKKIV